MSRFKGFVMAKTELLTGTFGGNIAIGANNETWIVAQGALGHGDGDPLFEEAGIDNTMIIDGKLETVNFGTAIFSHGVRTHIEIGKSANIDAYVGVNLDGSDQSLVNNGLISGGNNAVIAGGNNVDITNNGTMQSDIGVDVHSYQGPLLTTAASSATRRSVSEATASNSF